MEQTAKKGCATYRSLDGGDGDASGGLLVDKFSEAGLVLDDAVCDSHAAAQGGQPDHQLDRIDIAGNANKLRLLLLDQRRHVVQTVLEARRLLVGRHLEASLLVL